MKKLKKTVTILALIIILAIPAGVRAGDIYRLRMFFGLSIPGGGAVSLDRWEKFQRDELARAFEGFNVVDSTGYYKGSPERCKIVTLIVEEKDIPRAEALARSYAKTFRQESVMMVKVPVLDWRFIGAD